MSRVFTLDVYRLAFDRIHDMRLSYPELVDMLSNLSTQFPIAKTYIEIELGACAETGGADFRINNNRLEHICAMAAELQSLLMLKKCRLDESYLGRCFLVANTMKKQGLLGTERFFGRSGEIPWGVGYFFTKRRAIQLAAATWDTRLLRRK